MSAIPPERKLFASYALWRRHVDPDGLVTAGEFAEMDADDKREAMREIGGAEPAAAVSDDEPRERSTLAAGSDDEDVPHEGDEHDADEDEAEHDDDEDEEFDAVDGESDDDFVELTDDVVDERSVDPYA